MLGGRTGTVDSVVDEVVRQMESICHMLTVFLLGVRVALHEQSGIQFVGACVFLYDSFDTPLLGTDHTNQNKSILVEVLQQFDFVWVPQGIKDVGTWFTVRLYDCAWF